MDTKINHCEGSLHSAHNDPNKVIGLWVTKSSPSQVTVTLMWGNNPTQKGFLIQNLTSILVSRLTLNQSGHTKPTITLHTFSIPPHGLHVLSLPGRKGTQLNIPVLTVLFLAYLPQPILADIYSCELSIAPKCAAATNTLYHSSGYPRASVLGCQASVFHDFVQPYNSGTCWKKENKIWNDFACSMNEIWYPFFNCITAIVQTGWLKVIQTQHPDHHLHL